VSGGERFDEDLPSTVATTVGVGRSGPEMPSVGTRIGAWVLMAEIGRGGMGRVYLAQDVKLERKVAIKFVAVHGTTARLRFLDEARVTARCTHPNIVVIHDIAEHDGLPFMVLEYVPGTSLAGALRSGPIPPERAVPIMTQVARALVHAHGHAIIHRDLKPANILLGADGIVKVVDFGIAHPLDGPHAPHPPAGTVRYMAPEQVAGAVDPRSDLFAFGITMFQMLAGRRPHDDLDQDQLLDELRALDRPTPSLAEVRPELAPELTGLVDGCLEKRRERRIGSAAEVLAALDAMATPRTATALTTTGERSSGDGDTPAPAEMAMPVTDARRRRRGAAVAAIGAVAAALLVVTSVRRGAPGDGSAASGAALRVDELDAVLERLHAEGSPGDEQHLFEEFLEEERDPSAVALAWLHRGDRERGRGDEEAALVSYSSAYARTAEPTLQHEALVHLAGLYFDRWEWDRLAAAIDVDRHTGLPDDDRAATLHERSLLALRDPEARRAGSGTTAVVAAALLRGAPTKVSIDEGPIEVVDVDHDGRDELVLAERGDLVVRAAAGLAERWRRRGRDLGMIRCAGDDRRGAYAMTTGETTIQLHRLGGDAEPVVLDLMPARAPMDCAWVDLDGDGAAELYVVGARALFRIARDDAGGWQVARHPLGSEPWAVIGGDLDGDGRGELIVSVGEWRAYDVRAIRFDAAGVLHIADRVRLGVVTNLAPLGRDAAGRTVIAALKQDIWPSVTHLPVDHPLGAPAGVYRLAFEGGRLRVVGRSDLRRVGVKGVGGKGLFAADIDGDGRRDLLANMCTDEGRCDLAVLLAEPSGDFTTRVIGGVAIAAVVRADDDRADEAIALVDGEDTPWILGGGDRELPVATFPPVDARPAPSSAGGARAVLAAWRRAEDLAAIGLVDVAADALRRIGAFGASRLTQADALRRAAELLRARHLPDAEPLEALSRLEPDGSRAQVDALRHALDEHLAFAEIGPARRLLRALLENRALPLTAAERAQLVQLRARVDGTTTILFAGALHDAWRVHDPLLVHVPPGARALSIETLTPAPVATVPLVRGDGVLTLTMSAEVTRTEWGGALQLRLGPRDRGQPGGVTISIDALGGGGLQRRRFVCTGAPWKDWTRLEPLASADEPASIEVELAIVPAQRLARCTITADTWHESAVFAIDADVDPEWELSIGGRSSSSMTSAAVRITALEVTGLTAGDVPSDPASRAARALAEHRPDDALAALREIRGAAATRWPLRRIQIAALDATGARRRAIARLRAARPSDDDLAVLLRAREGELAPVVRVAAGRRLAAVLHRAWAMAIVHDLSGPRMVVATRDLDGLPLPDAATRDVTVGLLSLRGHALLLAGRADEARRVLAAAVAADRGTGDPDLRMLAEDAVLLLAVDAARRGRLDEADDWAARALAVSAQPELMADRLLLDPVTRPLASRPAGARIAELGRELALGW